MAQALSSLLQPQGKLLQVKPDMTEEMKEETKENINVELKREDKREQQTVDTDVAQPMQLDAEGLQQIVLQSGVLEAVLHIVKAVHKDSSSGQAKLKTVMLYSSSGIFCALCNIAFCQTCTACSCFLHVRSIILICRHRLKVLLLLLLLLYLATLSLVLHADLVTTRALYGTAHDMAKCLMQRMRTSKTTGAAGSPTRAGQTEHPTTALPVSPMSIQVRADN